MKKNIDYIGLLLDSIDNYQKANFDLKYKRLEQISQVLISIKKDDKMLSDELGLNNTKEKYRRDFDDKYRNAMESCEIIIKHLDKVIKSIENNNIYDNNCFDLKKEDHNKFYVNNQLFINFLIDGIPNNIDIELQLLQNYIENISSYLDAIMRIYSDIKAIPIVNGVFEAANIYGVFVLIKKIATTIYNKIAPDLKNLKKKLKNNKKKIKGDKK